ncbi:MAG: VOC family protein [Bacillaceae bacterium]
MIKGLGEAHLPVKNLAASMYFYEKLGLELVWKDEDIAFYWIEKGKSWLGLWEGKEVNTPYHPSLRHIAFTVTYEDIKKSVEWLRSVGIEAVKDGNRETANPYVRPYQGNVSVYFQDPDGNSLEFIAFIDVPEQLRHITTKLSIEEWEALLRNDSLLK